MGGNFCSHASLFVVVALHCAGFPESRLLLRDDRSCLVSNFMMGYLILGGQVGCPRLVDGPSCRVPCVVANPAEAGVRVAKFATS